VFGDRLRARRERIRPRLADQHGIGTKCEHAHNIKTGIDSTIGQDAESISNGVGNFRHRPDGVNHALKRTVLVV
jgi:hypothetical protein